MKKLLLFLWVCNSAFGMHKDYDSSTFKTYDYQKPYTSTLSCDLPEKNFLSRVYFQVIATKKPFYIPVVPHKKEPTDFELKLMKRAELHERTLYKRLDGVGTLRYTRDLLKRNYEATKSGMSKSTRETYLKEIALLNGYLSKYGIEDLEQIPRVQNVHTAIALYKGLAQAKHIDPKLVIAAKNALEARADYQEYLKQAEIDKVTDMVTTAPTKVMDIHPEVDKRIEDALNAIKIEDKDFDQHMKAVSDVLNHLKEQGLLNPSNDNALTPEMRDAIIHGIKHFIKEFKPNNPLDNPQEFIASTVKYAMYASFHCMTGGALLGAEKMAILGMQLNALMQQDFSQMSLEQHAEYMAEQAAEIVKAVFADQIGKKVLPNVKLPGLPKSAPSEVPAAEVVTSTGEIVPIQPEVEPLVNEFSGKEPLSLKREQVLSKVQTYEQARNKALEIIGEVDMHTKKPHIGKMGICENKIVGTDWHGEKVIIRLDYDAVKGPHINVTDYRMGKGTNGISVAIPFEGSEATVEALLKHLNTRANLEQAKVIFESKGDRNLPTIMHALKELRK